MANASFVVGSEGVAVIDTSGSAVMGRELRDAIRAVTNKPIKYVINTHMHPDHVFGNAAFNRTSRPLSAITSSLARSAPAPKATSPLTSRCWARRRSKAARSSCRRLAIKEPTTLDLGDRTLLLEPQPTAHTDNDLIVTDTKTDTLFLGDLLFSVHVPTIDGSIKGWLALLDETRQAEGRPGRSRSWPKTMELPQALEPEQRYLGDDRGRCAPADRRRQDLVGGDKNGRILRKRRLEAVRSVSCPQRHRGIRRTGVGVIYSIEHAMRSTAQCLMLLIAFARSCGLAALAASSVRSRRARAPKPTRMSGRSSRSRPSATGRSRKRMAWSCSRPRPRSRMRHIVPLDRAGTAVGEGQAQITDTVHRQESRSQGCHAHLRSRCRHRRRAQLLHPRARRQFLHVRAMLETEDGSLHMTTKFLAAAGGCAAMQAKDPDADTADMGKTIVRTFPPALDRTRSGRVR